MALRYFHPLVNYAFLFSLFAFPSFIFVFAQKSDLSASLCWLNCYRHRCRITLSTLLQWLVGTGAIVAVQKSPATGPAARKYSTCICRSWFFSRRAPQSEKPRRAKSLSGVCLLSRQNKDRLVYSFHLQPRSLLFTSRNSKPQPRPPLQLHHAWLLLRHPDSTRFQPDSQRLPLQRPTAWRIRPLHR
jgi:hypothetical protein